MNIKKISKMKWVKIGVLIFASAIIQAFALNNFFVSSGLLSGGMTGIGLIIYNLTNGAIPLSIFVLVANIPLAILGYFSIGKRFTILTFINVALTSLFLAIIPQVVELDEILLNAIVGGVINGVAIGLALEAGASTGGTDFISLYMSVKKQKSAGQYMLILNAIIIMVSAYFFKIDVAVYTIIATFVTTKVIDAIHVRYQRVTLAIITSKGDEIVEKLSGRIHGITVLDAKGGYTHEAKSFIYTVVSTYEIVELKEIIFEIDEHAFINVTSSQKLFGSFRPVKYD